MTRISRLFDLLQLLRDATPPITAEQLAFETGVSVRSIYRDIETLRGLGVVIDGAPGYGFHLIEDSSLPPQSFGEDELDALVLGLREVQQIGDPALAAAAGSALAKLQARLPSAQARRLQHAVLSAKHFSPPPAPGIDAAALRQAIWAENVVVFDYVDAKGNSTNRAVDPLSITFLDRNHCLLAHCHLRQDFRAFRLDRMTALNLTKQSFRPHRVPMLRDYMQILRGASATP